MNAYCPISLWISNRLISNLSNLCNKVIASLSGISVCQSHLNVLAVAQMEFLKALTFVNHTTSTSLTPFLIVFNAITDRNFLLIG